MDEKIKKLLKNTEGKQKVMAGMCPTGNMHLGHAVAVLNPYLKLQELSTLEDKLDQLKTMMGINYHI